MNQGEVVSVAILAVTNIVFTGGIFWHLKKDCDGGLFKVFSPLSVISAGLTLRYGVGSLIMLMSSGIIEDAYVKIWLDELEGVTIVGTLLHICILIGAYFSHAFINRFYSARKKRNTKSISLDRWLPYARLASWLSVFVAGSYIAGLLSGAYERQYGAYAEWVNASWRVDMVFIAFSRLRDIWFICLPLLLVKGKVIHRAIASFVFAIFILSVVLSGSRGGLLYPVAYMLLGYGVFFGAGKKFRIGCIFGLLLSIVLVPSIYALRETPEYQAQVFLRNKMEGVVRLVQEPERVGRKFQWVGRDLIACHDPFILRSRRDKSAQMAGWNDVGIGLSHILPKSLGGNREALFDGSDIARRLQGVENQEWAKVWFPCVSLGADLLRRGGHWGVVIGGLVAGMIIGLIGIAWRIVCGLTKSPGICILVMLPTTYLSAFPLGTVKESIWYVVFDMSKYVVVAIAIEFVRFLKANGRRLVG